MTTICGTVSRGHFRYITQGLRAIINPGIRRVYQICVYIGGRDRLDVRDVDTLCIITRNRKADDDTMHVGFDIRLGIPTESTIGEIYMDTKTIKKWLPYSRYLFALGDGVGGDEGSFNSRIDLHESGGFPIPCSYIINLAGCLVWLALFVHIDRKHILLLCLILETIPHKWRITHDKVQLLRRNHLSPFHPQRVAFLDIMVRFER